VCEVLALGDETFLINEFVHVRYGLRLKQQLSIEHVINSGQPDGSSALDELHVLV
jgi:hypothetical protein